jgi:dynein heavy chain, axonemal
VLVQDWIPQCVETVLSLKHHWYNIPANASADEAVAAYESLEHLFLCVGTLMARKVRECVEASLADFVELLQAYKSGNTFTPPFADGQVTVASLLTVSVLERNGSIVLDPPLEAIESTLMELCTKIATSASNLPRIESRIFPALADQKLLLQWGTASDPCVGAAQAALSSVCEVNTPGSSLYLQSYKKYSQLLAPAMVDNIAIAEAKKLLSDPERPLEALSAHIDSFNNLAEEILALRASVPLTLVLLNTSPLGDTLAASARAVASLVLETIAERGRAQCRSICDRFDGMALRLMERPTDTEHMTQLDAYMQTAKSETLFKLKSEIREMGERLRFLAGYGAITNEDISLNTATLKWPEKVEPMFEVTQRRVDDTRLTTETALRTRVADFEKKLEEYCTQIEAFREKTDGLRSEEVSRNVRVLETLRANMEEAKKEADGINREQELLGWEVTNFTQIAHVSMTAEPFEKLWSAAAQFNTQRDRWFDGPFLSLDAEAVSEELGTMWRVVYKLIKTFGDAPGPQKTAESLKGKMDKFKTNVPLLQCICNKGLRARHWEKISDLSGFDISPDATTSLSQMLAMNLDKLVEQIEEISSSASKEYSLEKALSAMKVEWTDLCFAFIPYRDTGVSILSGVDEVQVLLDDHIVKAQTMRGSPFIKPFEAEILAWEAKLLSMQVRASVGGVGVCVSACVR